MEIKINDQFYLLADSSNFIIAKPQKKGISEFVNIAYFGRLELALDFLIDKLLMESEAKTLEVLKNEIEKARGEIKCLIAKLDEKAEDEKKSQEGFKK